MPDRGGIILERTAAAHPPTTKEDDARITRSSGIETATGPSGWFTGTVYVDAI